MILKPSQQTMSTRVKIPKPSNLFIIIFICSSFSYADNDKDIGWWCSTTPHPETCNYFMGRDLARFNPRSNEDFRTMTIQAAMERAADAQSHAMRHGYKGMNKKNEIAHKDCNDLIENTILQLNATLESIKNNASFTIFDAQTWLSTALTNIETCRSGPRELNVSKFDHPFLSGNISELIRNSLATNGAILDYTSMSYGDNDHHREGFPGWVTTGDRKLLQDLSLSAKANVVVAKDGSGQFDSIQAAIDYSTSTRVGSARVVVYVKAGVYAENILINRTMSNVMLVRDGVRYTVITGSRSVSSGFTTYSSATVDNY